MIGQHPGYLMIAATAALIIVDECKDRHKQTLDLTEVGFCTCFCLLYVNLCNLP